MSGFIFPVASPNAQITSMPGQRWGRYHAGVDIAGPGIAGSPVIAPTDLRVTRAATGTTGGYGNVVYGVDGWGNEHRFAHLDVVGVSVGQTIPQGAPLGTVGNTGRSTGAHLHYEVRDKSGNFLKDVTTNVVSQGKKIAGDAINGFLRSNPITAPFAGDSILGSLNPFGGGDGCGVNPICHLRKWLEETSFVERGALYIIGTILIIGGILFLAMGYKPTAIAKKALSS